MIVAVPFASGSTVSLATSTIDLDWRTALPSRGLTTRVQQTITGGAAPQLMIDGLLTGQRGHTVGITGTILAQSGGTLLVNTDNSASFAHHVKNGATLAGTGVPGNWSANCTASA